MPLRLIEDLSACFSGEKYKNKGDAVRHFNVATGRINNPCRFW